ncbi:hypothetical protein EIQ06_04845 [Xanthomonas campestris pv. campestris]|nr:hypothetical protein D0A42_05935 [Xanthomonas campestris pv. campestris]RFF75992.1 hypothetical protein DZE36_05000 [Xanthomonas campestris pv. campestris]
MPGRAPLTMLALDSEPNVPTLGCHRTRSRPMKFKHILMLTLGAAAIAALPAIAQTAPPQGQGASAQKANDEKAKTEAERKAERRAAAAKARPEAGQAPREEEEEEKPSR